MDDIQVKITKEQDILDDILKQQRESLQSINQINLEKEEKQKETLGIITQIDQLTIDLESLKSDLDSVSVARAGKIGELAIIQTNINVARAEYETIVKKNDEANIAGVAANKKIEEDQQHIINEANSKVTDLTAKKIQLEKEIAPIEEQLSRFVDQISESNAKLVTVNASLIDTKKILADLENESSIVSSSIDTLNEKRDELEKEIADKTTERDSFDKEIADKTTELSGLEEKVVESRKELDANNSQSTDIMKQRASLIAGQQEVDQRLSYLKAKYGELSEPW